MQFLMFALSRLPDPYAIVVGGAIGFASQVWWQAVLGGVAGGLAMTLVFGAFGGMSSDAAVYFLVDALAVALWAALVFALRELLRRRKPAAL